MGVLSNLEPKAVFEYFEKLCAVPHGSGNTKQVSDLCAGFAKELGLAFRQDEHNNLVIWKEASPGYEDAPPVILQGHMDMVCAKTGDCPKDMAREGLDLATDGEWVWAEQTSLGGDNGVAVAMILAILADGSCPHPPLEAVFTADEEIGLVGAFAMDCSDLKGRRLLNLDSEEEGVFTVSCSGGERMDCFLPARRAPAAGEAAYAVTVSGLRGGHSGVDINKGRANANKLLVECLARLPGIRLIAFRGGEQDNAIPVQAEARVVMADSAAESAQTAADAWLERARAEYPQDDRFSLQLAWADGSDPIEALSDEDTRAVLRLLLDAPNGIQSMEPDLPGQVRTSLNMGVVRLEDGALRSAFCVRSSSGAEKAKLFDDLRALAQANGADYGQHGEYPAWEYRKDSPLRDVMVRVFEKQYGRAPVVETIHAGLECGLLAGKLPGLDAVSIGPDMADIHSARERLSVASVERTWDYLLEILAQL